MNNQPPLLDRINNNRILLHSLHPSLNIRLHKLQRPLLFPQALPRLDILRPQLLKRHQPRIQQPQARISQRGSHAPAAGMPRHDDMFHFEGADSVGDDALGAEVARVEDVGDVAMHEDVAGLEAEDGGLWAAGVGAADPEDLRALAAG